MRKIRRKKSQYIIGLISIVVLTLTIGYSFLSAHLMISGLAHVTVYWDVHFDNIDVNTDSVSLSSGDYAPTIDQNDSTKLAYKVTLSNPGDFYEFTVDVVNDGTIDAMIDEITPKINSQDISNLPSYLTYSLSYEDDVAIEPNQILNAGSTETVKIRLEVNQADSSLPQAFEMSFEEEYVKADENAERVKHPMPLYSILENEANSGSGLALKYTGQHKDSFTEQASKDIYHWYASNSTNGTMIQNMNNVIFANQCWQMIRTTDIGGVRLLYNGEAENNQCLNTRGTHEGYSSYGYYLLNEGNYWYGTDYYFNSETNTFQLTGTMEQALWSDSTASDLIGKYTCKLTDQNGTCTSLFYIVSYATNRTAGCLILVSNANYSDFGSLYYNYSFPSPAYGGYMYNKVYDTTSIRNEKIEYVITDTPTLSDTVTYWFSDSYSWSNGEYTLVNPYQISAVNDYSELKGKYTFSYYIDDPNSSYYLIYYIVDVIFDDYNNEYRLFLLRLTDNNTDPLYDVYTYGDSFTDNGDGTFTILNPSQLVRSEWYSKQTEFENVYVCKNATNNTCEDLWYVYSYTDSGEVSYWQYSSGYYFSGSYSYDNGQYHLGNDAIYIWMIDSENADEYDTHHYFCNNHSMDCTNLNYVADLVNGDTPGYITLSNGESEADAVHNMFYADDVNIINSTIKTGVDAWYKMKLLDYSNYVEDSIYCNNRTISNYCGWQNNGELSGCYLQFYGYLTTIKDIYCNNVTDQFSASNPKARLQYPVGILTFSEGYLLGHQSILRSSHKFWLMSPSAYTTAWGIFQNYVTEQGYTSSGYIKGRSYGVRPVITLKSGVEYSSGDGSMADPYVVNMN